MVVVNLYGYGDFDMMYVESTWVHATATNIKDLGIQLGQFDGDSDHSNAEKTLKSAGFKKIKAVSMAFGDV